MINGSNHVEAARGDSSSDEETQGPIRELAERVGKMAIALDAATVEQVSADVEAIVDETTRAEPRRRWYEVSLSGLKEAAEAVGDLGKPVLETVARLTPLLLGG